MAPSTTQASGKANGHRDANGNGSSHSEGPLPVTKLLAAFISRASPSDLKAPITAKVKEVLLDTLGCAAGALQHAESTPSILAAITAFQGPSITKSTPGTCTVIGQGCPKHLPHYAGLLNAALGHSLDFDDTFAEGTLHAGVTAIPAALAAGEALASAGKPPSTREVMLAIAVGYEVTCRLGRELGFAAYSRGFHNTSTCGVFGAIAALAVLRKLDAPRIEMAFGLAGSKAAGSMQYLSNGSWNKRLHPGFAVHDAFLCVQLAEAGVRGADAALEGKNGFLHAYSPSQEQDLRRLVSGLGVLDDVDGRAREWIFLRSALKPYPACRMTHGFIEMCGAIHTALRPVRPQDVERIELTMSPANFILIGDPTPNKRHPANAIDAQFSAYFQVAHSLLYGAKTGDMSAYGRLEDEGIHELTEKIDVRTDESMSAFAARLTVAWANGEVLEREQLYPLGEVEHPFTTDKVEEKFLAVSGGVWGGERSRRIVEVIERIEEAELMSLIELLR